MTDLQAPTWRDTFAALAVLAAAAGMAAALTDGFERWTFEELRRERALRGEIHAGPVQVVDTQARTLLAFAAAPRCENQVLMVDFIYTRCLTVCQTLGVEFYQMQERVRGTSRPALLSISIDPVRDGPADLAAYARMHRADAALWSLAAPATPADARRLARQLGVVAVPDGFGGFVHNGAIHVMDACGRVHGIFDHAHWTRALELGQQVAAEASQ